MPVAGRHAAVVGGSLTGLCAGLALARAGWQVTIIERATGEPPGGAGLGLDRRLLSQVTGVDAAPIPVVRGNRDSAAWGLVRQFLLDVYTAFALLMEDSRGREVLPIGRLAMAHHATHGSLAMQLRDIERQPGVRRTL